MNYLKILILFFGTFSFSASFAANEVVDRVCRPVLEKKCTAGNCADGTLNIVIDGMYNKCENSINDVEKLKSTTDVSTLNLNSDVGYLIGFSNLISRALAGKASSDKFTNVKQDYTSLTGQYKKYLKNNRAIFLSSLDFLEDNTLKSKILEEDKASQKKVNERMKKLELMMQSEESLLQYRQTHAKFIPAILFENNVKNFKENLFTAYECNFLKINFDETEIRDLEKTLNYRCEK